MMSRLPGSSPKRLAQQIGHAAAGGQRREVAGVAHVGDQADEIVFVRPDIPFSPAVLLEVSSQVAVLKLAFDQLGGHVVQLLAQRAGRPY